jgi:hypothetical protein
LTRDDAAEIKRLLNQNLEGVISKFWPGALTRGRVAYCAPTGRSDDLGSFVVYLGSVGKYHRGEWQRSSKGIGGDELNLFAYGDSGERSHKADKETFASARRYLNLDTSRPETEAERERRTSDQAAFAKRQEENDRRAREREKLRTRTAAEIWAESVPIAGTHAEAYLLARGLLVPPEGWPDALRFHRGLAYDLDDSLSFPVLVCRVDDCFGDITAVWRIFLDAKKPAKAAVAKSKLGLGVAAGGAVRLGEVADQIGIAEGIESALGAMALIKYRFPVFAGLSTSGLAGFEVPLGVSAIRIFADGDKPWRKAGDDIELAEPAGRAAARKLKARLDAIGITALIEREPPMGKDFLDIWVARQRAEARA